MDYLDFDIEDFAADDFFVKWVLEPDPGTSRFWEDFIIKHPSVEFKIEKARALLLNIRKAEQTAANTSQIDAIWSRIDAGIFSVKENVKRPFPFYKIAASIALFVLVSAGIWLRFAGRPIHENEIATSSTGQDLFIEELNTTGALLKIHLSDGSTVSLENNSRLRYRKDFSNQLNREVYLIGEGFFDIAKNPRQPFLVYANEIVTKVLGTSFRIKAYETDPSVTVSVKEGKVSVSSNSSKKTSALKADTIQSEVNGVVLSSNQQVIYLRNEDSFERSLVEKPEIISEKSLRADFKFENEPIKNVFDVLEVAYGVEIIFDNEVMQNCYLTAPLGNEPLFEKLKIICRTIGATYEIMDAKIVVSSKGC
jgi:transmembrane sensor